MRQVSGSPYTAQVVELKRRRAGPISKQERGTSTRLATSKSVEPEYREERRKDSSKW